MWIYHYDLRDFILILRILFKDVRVFPFGSTVTGLQIKKDSDLDLAIWCPYNSKTDQNCLEFLRQIHNCLIDREYRCKKSRRISDDFKISIKEFIQRARTPIIILSVSSTGNNWKFIIVLYFFKLLKFIAVYSTFQSNFQDKE